MESSHLHETHNPCEYHRKNPRTYYGIDGCTCSWTQQYCSDPACPEAKRQSKMQKRQSPAAKAIERMLNMGSE